MKKIRIERIIAVLLAVLLLSSCTAKDTGGVSSLVPKEEGETQSFISSAITEEEKEETEEEISSKDTQQEEQEKEQNNTDKNENSSKKEEDNISSKPDNKDTQSKEEQKEPQDTSSNKEQNKPDSEQGVQDTDSDIVSNKKEDEITSSDTINNQSSPNKPSVPSTRPNKSDTSSNSDLNKKLKELVKPIFRADKMQGSKIDFDVNTIDISIANDNWDSEIAVVRSFDDLKDIYEGEKETISAGVDMYFEKDDYTKLYPSDFFEDNELILLFVYRGVKARKYSIDSVSRYGDSLYIHMDNVDIPKDAILLQVTASYRTFISVPKGTLDNITNVYVCED